MLSVPKGRPCVSPGHRPGKTSTVNPMSPNGAALLNADERNDTCLTNQDNGNARRDLGPPRWGLALRDASITQAVGLG
jgi:hypothetical protein